MEVRGECGCVYVPPHARPSHVTRRPSPYALHATIIDTLHRKYRIKNLPRSPKRYHGQEGIVYCASALFPSAVLDGRSPNCRKQ
jgi:hypothetical protein